MRLKRFYFLCGLFAIPFILLFVAIMPDLAFSTKTPQTLDMSIFEEAYNSGRKLQETETEEESVLEEEIEPNRTEEPLDYTYNPSAGDRLDTSNNTITYSALSVKPILV
jgi:hypothetical protein